jgi:cysteine desulfuration protein SufE
MSVDEKQRLLVSKLAVIEDPHERLAALMSRAKKFPAPTPGELTGENRVHGCQSRVWLAGNLASGLCHWRMECDAPMVKGLVALLCELYEGGTPADVLAVEPLMFEELGISRMVSPTRMNGLAAVRGRIKQLAAAFAVEAER